MRGLRFGPVPRTALHLCIDMQRMFASGTSWASEAVGHALPAAVAVTRSMPERTIFTRFITPPTPQAVVGVWSRYYERWRDVVQDRLSRTMLELMPELQAFVPPARVIDKPTYSAFRSEKFTALLAADPADTLLFTGVETEICIYATLMSAIDRGYRCILVEDGVWSPDEEAHEATLDILLRRLDDHVEIVSSAEITA